MRIDNELYERHNDYRFRAPIDLQIAENPPKRALVIGACFAEGMAVGGATFCDTKFDYVSYTNAGELPDQPPRPMEEYDFQLVVLPLSSFLPPRPFVNSPDEFAYDEFLSDQKALLARAVSGALQWSKANHTLTFFTNFVVPAQNARGRLLSRYAPENPQFFVEELNRELDQLVRAELNVHVIDVDGIGNTFGKKTFHDDHLWSMNHGQFLTDWDYDLDAGKRLEEIAPASQHYKLNTYEFQRALWHEILAVFRTIRGSDAVKLVVIDLDDTLWRGIIGENTLGPHSFGGWTGAFGEALLFLKSRGILLAIISKNYEDVVRSVFEMITRSELLLSDFCAIKINWKPKIENMAELLEEVGLLSKSVIYIDDNPVERAAMQAQFPEIRTLGSHPYYLRRIMLGAPELQVPYITTESINRTKMVQSQVVRERQKREMPREEFLATLGVKVVMSVVRIGDSKFDRALELLNKTNQFNTTGLRWSQEEIVSFFNRGGLIHSFEVEDKYTNYGLVGVILVDGNSIIQFAMSCRVLGLDIELAVLAHILVEIFNTCVSTVIAKYVPTASNRLCSDLFSRAGFDKLEDDWMISDPERIKIFSHVSITSQA